MAKHNDLGKWGEDLAAEYLQKQGFVIRDRDWHCGKRDIDLVAITADLTTVVFVEVNRRGVGTCRCGEQAEDKKPWNCRQQLHQTV